MSSHALADGRSVATSSSARPLILAVAAVAGLTAGAATDGLLDLTGTGAVTGLQVGVALAPLLALFLLAPVRRAFATNPGVALAALGVGWTLAPLIDQHLTGVVVLEGTFADALHHLAGWPALIAGTELLRRRTQPRWRDR